MKMAPVSVGFLTVSGLHSSCGQHLWQWGMPLFVLLYKNRRAERAYDFLSMLYMKYHRAKRAEICVIYCIYISKKRKNNFPLFSM